MTEQAVYILEGHVGKRRIPFPQVSAITVSLLSMEFVLHVCDNFDVRLSSVDRRSEIIERIIFIICNLKTHSKFLKFYEMPQLNLLNVMTTETCFRNKKRHFPPEGNAKALDFKKYGQRQEIEKSRATLLRKNTVLLVQKSKEKLKDISMEDFELLKLLGRGACGSVFLGRKKGSNKLYAIKRINKAEIVFNEQLGHTKTEKDILSHVNHAFLVSLDYAFQTGTNLYFVMEFMKGGELTLMLRKKGRFDEIQARFYVICVLFGLAHLHNRGFVYRDLKLENLLLDEMGYIKLTDFGLAKFVPSDSKTDTFCGTSEYIAPEILSNQGHDRLVDWWSLGILIYYFLFGRPPFQSMNSNILYKKIVNDEVEFPETPKISKEAKAIIVGLLKKNPKERLGSKDDSSDILGHAWLCEMDVERILVRSAPSPFIPETEEDKWEDNFEEECIQERVRGTAVDDLKTNLEKFQKEFEEMNFCTDDSQKIGAEF